MTLFLFKVENDGILDPISHLNEDSKKVLYEALSKINFLEKVIVNLDHVSEKDLPHIAKIVSNNNLISLVLKGDYVSDYKSASILKQANPKFLKELVFESEKAESLSGKVMVNILEASSNIETLQLTKLNFEEYELFKIVTILSKSQTLVSLNLSLSSSQMMMKRIPEVLQSTTLTDLNLSFACINYGIKELSVALTNNKNLLKLNLSSNKLVGNKLKLLVDGIIENKTLQELNISKNGIGQFMYGHIMHLVKRGFLRKLIMQYNEFELKGRSLLESSIKESYTLSFVDLSFNKAVSNLQYTEKEIEARTNKLVSFSMLLFRKDKTSVLGRIPRRLLIHLLQFL